MSIIKPLLIASALLLLGCGSVQPTPQLAPAKSMGDGYVCKGSACKDDWTKTQLWVSKHSLKKIQISNDSLIQTYTPRTAGDYLFAFTATKEPLGNNTYKIKIEVADNVHSRTDPREIEKAFYYYLTYGKDLLVPLPKGIHSIY